MKTLCLARERGNYHIPPPRPVLARSGERPRCWKSQDGVTRPLAAFDLLRLVLGRPCERRRSDDQRAGLAVSVAGRSDLSSTRDPAYSEKEGAMYRFFAPGAPEAHDNALAFLAQLAG